jgi:hypothetical protein
LVKCIINKLEVQLGQGFDQLNTSPKRSASWDFNERPNKMPALAIGAGGG